MTPADALEAIRARIDGEWDHPALIAFGPLSTNTLADVIAIVRSVESQVPRRA